MKSELNVTECIEIDINVSNEWWIRFACQFATWFGLRDLRLWVIIHNSLAKKIGHW